MSPTRTLKSISPFALDADADTSIFGLHEKARIAKLRKCICMRVESKYVSPLVPFECPDLVLV